MGNRRLGFLLVAALWAGLVTIGESSVDDAHNMVKNTYSRLAAQRKSLRGSKASHAIYKRSTSDSDIPEQCPQLLELVHEMCKDGNTPRHLNTTSCGEALSTDLSFYNNSTLPDMFLSKVKATRRGNEVDVEFDVIHTSASSKIFVLQYRLFDARKTMLDSTEKLEKCSGDTTRYLTRGTLTVDRSYCEENSSEFKFEIFFDGKSHKNGIEGNLDICRYDRVLNKQKEKWEKSAEGEQSEISPMPMFKEVSGVGNDILIEKGKNPTFEFELRLTPNKSFRMYCSLWDWQKNKSESGSIEIKHSEDAELGIEVEDNSDGPTKWLTIDVLKATNVTVERSGTSEEDNEIIEAKIKATVNVGSMKMSGWLLVVEESENKRKRNYELIEEVETKYLFELKLPYKILVWPDDYVEWSTRDVQCDEGGNRDFRRSRFGGACVVDCSAYGTHIKSIFITKTPYQIPLRSASYVIKSSHAYVIQDVSPASEDPEGIYQCTVILENGQARSKQFSLVTSGFTEVIDFTFKDLRNSTVRLECAVNGLLPTEIEIEARRDDWSRERIDNKDGAYRQIVSSHWDNGTITTTLFVSVPIKELKNPRGIECRASGKGGDDEKKLGTSRPRLDREKPTMVKGTPTDTTTTIYCLETSSELLLPVEMMVMDSNDDRIDNKPGNVRSVERTDDGNLLTVIVPTSLVETGPVPLFCIARNRNGEDWIEVAARI